MPAEKPRVEMDSKLESLQARLEKMTGLSDLDRSVKRDVARWMLANGPYANPGQLEAKLSKTGIQGLKRVHQQAIANSFKSGIARRPLLAAALGISSLASLGAAARLFLEPTEPGEIAESSAPNESLFLEVNSRQQTIGQTLRSLVQRNGVQFPKSGTAYVNWTGLVHALDMSNWIEAANFLYDSRLWQRIEPATQDQAVAAIARPLLVLYRAWVYLLHDRPHWKDELFVGYAFGKMPTLAAPAKGEYRYPGSDTAAREHMDAIHRLAGTFNLLEILNQRYQRPGTTTAGAPIRFTQGHNFTYAHASAALEDPERFQPVRRTVLVNWDAHADLGTPFDNPRVDLHAPFQLLQNAKTFDERLGISSYMSIAGWILALVYEGFLGQAAEAAELVWIAPKEAQETSHNCMEPYGQYTIAVGDWKLPGEEEIERYSNVPVGDWDVPGETEIRSYSDRRTLSTVTTPEVLNNQRTCRVHIMDPDEPAAIEKVIGDAQVFLSGDVDYSGTQEPGLRPRRGFLPHYPLNGSEAQEARHRQLIGQFGDFYQRYQGQIRAVSVANSPNFTVDEQSRKPAAGLLRAVTGNNAAGQPQWIEAEWNRVATPSAEGASPILKIALTAGGATGLLALVGALELHRQRVNEIRSLDSSSGP